MFPVPISWEEEPLRTGLGGHFFSEKLNFYLLLKCNYNRDEEQECKVNLLLRLDVKPRRGQEPSCFFSCEERQIDRLGA